MARPSPLDLYKHLDKSNCGDCGYDTCMAFATDLLERKISLEDCSHLQKPDQKKNLKKIKELIRPPQRPVEFGVGDRKITIGGEEVLMRHQLTFWNPTGIFIEIADNQENLEETAKYLTDLELSRIGEDLTIQFGIALRNVSQNKDTFVEAANKLKDYTNLPIILCTLEPEFLMAAGEAIKDIKPLLYAATKDTWETLGKFAFNNNLPLVVSSPDLDELMSLSTTLQKLGLQEIVLDPGTFYGHGAITKTYDNIQQLRIAGIQKENENAGWPVMGVPAVYWTQPDLDESKELWEHQYQEIIMGSIMISIDTNLIVLHTGADPEDIWGLLALMTLRQSVFSDPRIYPAVDPGIYKIGEPGDMAPIFVTSNYRMTKIPVEQDLESANIDCYLLVVDSEGIGIESAVAGGQFSAGKIAETVKEFNAFDNVDHRILVIPGMAARLSGALEDEADCYVVVGPRDSSGIPKYVEKQWKPEEFMKEYESWKE